MQHPSEIQVNARKKSEGAIEDFVIGTLIEDRCGECGGSAKMWVAECIS